jgi:hypothetical protein
MSHYEYRFAEFDRQDIPTGSTEAAYVVGLMNEHGKDGFEFFMFNDSLDSTRALIFRRVVEE